MDVPVLPQSAAWLTVLLRVMRWFTQIHLGETMDVPVLRLG